MQKVAIVGLSCLFPGAETPAQYWQNLIEQRYTVSSATANEMGVDPDIFYHPDKGQRDKYYCAQGGFVRDFAFNPHGYHLPSDLLAALDTVFQWPLYVAHEALRDAGYRDNRTALNGCGVVLGNLSFPTKASHRLLMPLYHRTLDRALQTLFGHSFRLPTLPRLTEQPLSPYNVLTAGLPSSIVRQALGLGAAHLSLDAACASSLYAVKLACQYLLAGKADLMLAGAVSAADPIFINSGFSIFQAYPEDGVNRPLDQATGGLIAGEGAGMFLLKRHDEAVRDGDKIYAVIRGIGLSNDGRGKHLLSPNSKGQRLVFERAYADAAVSPTDIEYIECHATGTKLGDITELNSMAAFFGPHGSSPLIGSAKSNFGHMLTNAGMAGMTKVILSMLNETIPATARIDTPLESDDKLIKAENTVRERLDWPQSASLKQAAVSAFGFGGTNAHIVLEEGSAALEPSSPKSARPPAQWEGELTPPPPTPLAIVGMDAFFGPCDSLSAFKRTIHQGEQAFVPLPPNRWKGIEQETDLLTTLGFAEGDLPHGAYIDSFDMDFLRFRIPPSDSDQPDPQQLLILKVVDNALQDAGFDPTVKEQNVAVLVAMSTELSLHQFRGRVDLTWQLERALSEHGLTLTPDELAALENITKDSLRPEAKVNQYISYIGNIMAARIAAHWDFSGPAFTISAEENSTFRALEVAQMLLSSGEAEAVVVGAVDLAGGVENVVLRQQLSPLNTGRATMSLDEQSNGWLIGEGAGAVVLKRPDLAADRKVYATIEAVSFNTADRAAPQHALQTAGLQPSDIGYVELSASGIAEQDEVEWKSLLACYNQPNSYLTGFENLSGLSDEPTIALGSVKATVGHTFAASGMASLIKTALCVHQQYIPATPNWSGPKNSESWTESPFYVPTDSRPWLLTHAQSNRFAAINSMAVDGSQAHLILAGADNRRSQPHEPSPTVVSTANHLDSLPPHHLFLLAGPTQADLLQQLEQLPARLTQTDDLATLAAQCYLTYQQHRPAPFSLSLVATTAETLQREISLAEQSLPQAFSQQTVWRTPSGSYFAPQPQGREGQVVFVYPGGFNGYLGMGRNLGQICPSLYEQFAELTAEVSETIGDNLLYPRRMSKLSTKAYKTLQRQALIPPKRMMAASTSYSILTTALLRDYFGLTPQMGLGYSLGEFTMLWALGVWRDGDAYNVRNRQAELFSSRLSGPRNTARQFFGLPEQVEIGTDDIWGNFVVKGKLPQIEPFVQAEPHVFVTHINTPTELVIAGDPTRCQQVIEQAQLEAFRAPFNDVLHCEPVLAEYEAIERLNHLPVYPTSRLRFYSSSTYGSIDGLTSEQATQMVARCLSQPVDFPRLINQIYDDGGRIFVELGPQATCSRWIGDCLAGRPHVAMSVDHRKLSDHVSVVRLLSALASEQLSLNLEPLYQERLSEVQNGAVKSPPKVIKQVELGGPSIRAQILTADNQAHFSKISPLTAQPQPSRGDNWWHDGGNQPSHDLFSPLVPANDLSLTTSAPQPLLQPQEILVKDDYTNGSHPPTQTEPNPEPLAAVSSDPVAVEQYLQQQQQLSDLMLQANRNHALFLETRHAPLQQLTGIIQTQIDTCQQLLGQAQAAGQTGVMLAESRPPLIPPKGRETHSSQAAEITPRPHFPESYSNPKTVIWDEADLLEFAQGDISKVFGEQFKPVDGYTKKVRLPMPPYLLVSRITELEAEVGQYKPSFIQTEYDIPVHGWYCTDGQAPSAVAVESGQCDLMLISYLGIDFENQGDRMYRLLDCTLTFTDELPVEGQTLRYDISINRFARSAGPLLFFFSYNCYVGDTLILTMRNGCAGFFTQQELDDGRGVIYTEREIEAKQKVVKSSFDAPLKCTKTSFSEADMRQLCVGNIAACFGEAYHQPGRNPSLRLPPEDILMVDRVPQVDPHGGAWGLGLVVGEKIIEPDHWYFPCHFKDDEVLAGSLIAEGCVQLIEFYLLYLGLQVHTTDARFQPIPDLAQVVRCRGETTPCSDIMVYRMEITEIGLTPAPYAKANVQIHFQGRIVVDFQNLSLQLKEKSADDPYALSNLGGVPVPAVPITRRADMVAYYDKYQNGEQVSPPLGGIKGGQDSANLTTLPQGGKAQTSLVNQFTPSETAIYHEADIENFAKGSFAQCFGPEYGIYDQPGRRAPRTPNGPLKLISRIVEIEGTRGNLKAGSKLVSEYDVPVDAWWYRENSYPTMPYSILMEIALQPCGFLTAHLGSTLPAPETNYFFRNLDGHGTLLYPQADDLERLRGKTIVNQVEMTASSVMGLIIQKFDFELLCDGVPFYKGFASFGYFTAEALANQVGLDQGRDIRPWYEQHAAGAVVELSHQAVKTQAHAGKPHYRLADRQLNFLDAVKIVPNGGEFGQGYIYASKQIEPADWFFTAHFHEDPVMPGSLGVEAILEAMQIYALQQDLGGSFQSPYFEQLPSHKITWKYRGQIIRANKQMYLEVHFSSMTRTPDQVTLIGKASLWRDGMRIYEVTDIGLCLREAGA